MSIMIKKTVAGVAAATIQKIIRVATPLTGAANNSQPKHDFTNH